MQSVRRAGATRVGVAEPAHGDPDADVSARWRGREIFVQGYPTEARDSDYRILDDIEVDGQQVLEVKEFGRRRLVVECAKFTFEVSKFPDDRWDSGLMTSFVAALIDTAC